MTNASKWQILYNVSRKPLMQQGRTCDNFGLQDCSQQHYCPKRLHCFKICVFFTGSYSNYIQILFYCLEPESALAVQAGRSRIEVSMVQSRFAELPDTLLSRIFSCKSLAITDKVRCEHVCSAWRALLRCSQVSLQQGVWAEVMPVHICTTALI